MNTFLATFIKEFKILIDDKTGLIILFAMPLFLVLIMTLIQNQAYKNFKESGISVLLVNRDHDRLGDEVENGFKEMTSFNITVGSEKMYPNDERIKQDVLDGKYVVALVIPKGATAVLRGSVENMISMLLEDTPADSAETNQKVNFTIIVDPIAKKSFLVAVNSGLREYVGNIKTKLLFELMSVNISGLLGNSTTYEIPQEDIFVFTEESALAAVEDKMYAPNAVQHNIPAWAIFSVFFIVLPLSGSIINERSEGLAIRLNTFPSSYLALLSGKLALYLFIACMQFVMVLLLGEFLFPWIDLPQLEVGAHYGALIVLTIAVAVSAIGYGLMIGTIFDAPAQASIFGGITIMIMSALGGIWVPVNVMPAVMRTISEFSPLNWALTGYYELFIKGLGFEAVKYNVFKLGAFFVLSTLVSFALYKAKNKFQ